MGTRSLDRGRGGILEVFQDREAFKKAGVEMVSVQEPWLESDLLLAIAAWLDDKRRPFITEMYPL